MTTYFLTINSLLSLSVCATVTSHNFTSNTVAIDSLNY